ncbi:MAG: hypothetical protein CSA04_05225, partial [Bacteroidetes bacterium]
MFLRGSASGLLEKDDFLWTQVGGPSVTIEDPTNLTTEVLNFVAGNTYTFRLSTTCEDGSFIYQDVVKEVLPLDVANAGPDAVYCSGTANLAASAVSLPGSSGVWQTVSGYHGVTVSNVNDPMSTIQLNSEAAGVATLIWTVTTNEGCTSIDTVLISNRGGVTPIDAGPDQALSHCYSVFQETQLDATFAGANVAGQGGQWTVISGPNTPTFENTTLNTSRLYGLIEGTYVLRWTASGPCVSGYDEMTITVPPATASVTEADAGLDQFFCDPGTVSTVLSGNTPLYVNETVSWTESTAHGANIVNPSVPVTEVNNLDHNNDFYTFIYTITNTLTGCVSSDEVQVNFNPDPPVITIANDQEFTPCEESEIDIAFTSSGDGWNQYRIVSGPTDSSVTYPTDWINVNAPSPLHVTGLTQMGTYNIQMRRYTYSVYGPGCGTAMDDVEVITSYEPSDSNAGTCQYLDCDKDSTSLKGNKPDRGIGTWSMVLGPQNVIFDNPHNDSVAVSDLTNGTYRFKWLISGGPMCDEKSDYTEVVVSSEDPEAVSAGPDKTVCAGSPFFMDAESPQYEFEKGTWVSMGDPTVTFVDEHDPKTEVLGMDTPDKVYQFKWQIKNGCGTASDVVVITTGPDQGPMASDAGADQCLGDVTSFTLEANDPTPFTGEWSQIEPAAPQLTMADNTLYNTEVTKADTDPDGTYTFVWTISGVGCVPSRDTVQVTLNDPVTPSQVVANDPVCGSSVELIANDPATGSGVWTQISGNGGVTISEPYNHTTTASHLTDGNYQFVWTITHGACSSADTTLVLVSTELPSSAEAGPNRDVCGSTSTTMAATAPPSGTGQWSVVSGPSAPNFASPNSPTSTVSPLITGDYTFRWTVTAGQYCGTSSDLVDVSVVAEAEAGANQEYCENITSVNLVGNVASTGNWTQVGTTPAVAVITPTGSNTAIASSLTATGVYTFKYTISTPTCSSSDVMTVTLLGPPSTANAGQDREYCNVASFTLEADVPASGTGEWSVLSGPSGGTFSNVNDPKATFTCPADGYGLYLFEWTVSNGSCSNADQVRHTNWQSPTTAEAGVDQTVVCATSTVMEANDPTVGTGQWSWVTVPSGSLPTIASPMAYNTEVSNLIPDTYPGTYTLKWAISNGSVCATSSDVVDVTVQRTPTPAEAGPDQAHCEEIVGLQLAATNPTIGTGTWSWVSKPVGAPDPIFAPDANTANAIITNPASGGAYELKWTTSTVVCTSSDVVVIENS